MASLETKWFTKGGKNLIEAEISWVASPIHVILMASGYIFNQDGPEAYPDVSASETTGTAYVVGGAVIANRSVVIDPSSNGTRLLGDPVQWPNSTIAARGAIIYMNAGVQPLLGFVDFVTDRTSENGLFRIEWPTSGVLSLQAF